MVVRRIKDARLPKVKTLEEFDFAQTPQVSASRIQELAEGGYIERAEGLRSRLGAWCWLGKEGRGCGGVEASSAEW